MWMGYGKNSESNDICGGSCRGSTAHMPRDSHRGDMGTRRRAVTRRVPRLSYYGMVEYF